MLKKDLLEKVKNAKDDEDINSLLSGTDIEEQFKGNGATLDLFKEKLKKDMEFKAYLEVENGKYHSKALETWKKDNLEKELEPFIKEKYPELVTDPKDKEMLEMKKKLEQMEKDAARKDLLSDAIKYATEKKLPLKFVDKFLGEDLDKTKANLDMFGEDWSKELESLVDEKMKESSYIPGGVGADGSKISIGAAIAAQNNQNSNNPSDPWASK